MPMSRAEDGANFAETCPLSIRLMASEPIATPTEKTARNKVATLWSA